MADRQNATTIPRACESRIVCDRTVAVEPVRKRTFLGLGRVKAIRRKAREAYGSRDRSFSLHLVEYLNCHTGVAGAIFSAGNAFRGVRVYTGCGNATWALDPKEELLGLTRPVWDCYLAIAEALLAMPVPSDSEEDA
jgi:hypothetical protein